MRNTSRFASLFMAASLLLTGCDVDVGQISLVGAENELHETWEKELKVGRLKDDREDIDETNIIKEGEIIGFVVDNGNKSYGVSTMRIFLYRIDGDSEYVLSNTLADKDPIHAWSMFSFEDLPVDTYKVRVYLGEEYFDEVDFEIVEK